MGDIPIDHFFVMTLRRKITLRFSLVVFFAIFVGAIVYPHAVSFVPPLSRALEKLQINLGLDLQGGIHLQYAIDLSRVESDKKEDALAAVHAVVERRVNAFGVGEPLVQLAKSGTENFLIVELPGVKDMDAAKKVIKETPFLEFHEERPQEEVNKILAPFNDNAKKRAQDILARIRNGEDFEKIAREFSDDPGSAASGGDLDFAQRGMFVPEFDAVIFDAPLAIGAVYSDLVETQFGWHIIRKDEERWEGDKKEVRARHILIAKANAEGIPDVFYKPTELTGTYLKRSDVNFGSGGFQGGISEPQVLLQFDEKGAELFADITKRNLQKTVAIFVDNELVSAPVVQSEITNGEAVISGNFTLDEAKNLSQRLNEGALPAPITLVAQQSVEASLGQESLALGLRAGIIGLCVVMAYMIFYYRFLGLVAASALLIYAATMITLLKFSSLLPQMMSITLTLPGIAGLILSVGMAVDANVLIFERLKEEMRSGKSTPYAVEEAFRRAWPSIRDGNYSTILTSLILIFVGTSFVKGFALILVIGVTVSMFTAIVIVKNILRFALGMWSEKYKWLLMFGAPRTETEKESHA